MLTPRVARSSADYQPVLDELPRACQMLIDTTVGVDLWASLAASRVEGFLAASAASEPQAISAR